ncbi:MAG: hypothetical protein Q4C42_04160 [Clostridia bacterium]|nr:hypothetical protein [Clostridia bacterium]
MKDEKISMGVSAKTFESRMKKLMREDLLNNEFKEGEFRGRIADGKFYMFISEDGPRNTTPVMRGKYDDNSVSWHYTKPRASYIFSGVLSAIFLIVAILFTVFNGLVGLAFILPVPFIVSPWFRKGKVGDRAKLEAKVRETANKLA